MALIVEDGTGLANAEAYASEVYADDYHEKRGNTDWNLIVDKEAALRLGTDYMIQMYRAAWKGYRYTSTQALDWPRGGIYLNDYAEEIMVATTIIPIEVKNACCELALKTYTEEALLTDEEQKVIQETIGPLSVKYSDTSSTPHKQYSAILAMLKPYLRPSTLSVIR